MKMEGFCMMVAALLLAGCATPLQTRSGGPEVTVHGVDMPKVKAAFENDLADAGFAIRSSEGASIVAERDGDVFENVMWGSTTRPMTKARIRLNVIGEEPEFRVLLHQYIDGVIGEQELKGNARYWQWRLECVAAGLEGKPQPERTFSEVGRPR